MTAVSPQEQILGIVNNHWQSCCVGAAAQLELADLLADGPLHVDILAERTKTHGPSLYRMLRALESTGIFTQTAPRVFGNTPASDCLRRNMRGIQLGLDSLHALLGRAGIRGMARVDAVLEERVARLRSGDRPERLGAHAIEPGDGHDLQPGDAGPEHLDQSGRGRRLRLEPIPRDRRYRRRHRLATIEHPRRASLVPRRSLRSTERRRRGAGRQPNRACRRRLLQRRFPSKPTRTSCAGCCTIGRTRSPSSF